MKSCKKITLIDIINKIKIVIIYATIFSKGWLWTKIYIEMIFNSGILALLNRLTLSNFNLCTILSFFKESVYCIILNSVNNLPVCQRIQYLFFRHELCALCRRIKNSCDSHTVFGGLKSTVFAFRHNLRFCKNDDLFILIGHSFAYFNNVIFDFFVIKIIPDAVYLQGRTIISGFKNLYSSSVISNYQLKISIHYDDLEFTLS